jgi:hypothetical protein
LQSNHYNNLLIFCSYFILLFWLIKSYSSHIGLNYLVTVSAILIILVTQQLVNYKKLIYTLLGLFFIISIIMMLDKSRMHDSDQINYQKYVMSGLINHC